MDTDELVTGTLIHSIRLFRARQKRNRELEEVVVSRMEGSLIRLAVAYNANLNDLRSRFPRLRGKADMPATAVAPTPSIEPLARTENRPILLLSDSMFKTLKACPLLYPISHSGERAEDIIFTLNSISFVRPKAIVLNHGLNHTRFYGNPRSSMEEVFRTLCIQYPDVPLYHFQPPFSPSVLINPIHMFRISNFSRLMIEVGFIPIQHPELPRWAYGNDRFHYSPDGVRAAREFIINLLQ